MSRKQGEDSLHDKVLHLCKEMYTYKCYIFYITLFCIIFYIVFLVWFPSFILNLSMKVIRLGEQTLLDIPFS